ncbi:MAG: hypothetical protein HWE34_04480 [Methylocystaceae bacterium]|nr:hypothetical protein [Methylocystaceae bacterium]
MKQKLLSQQRDPINAATNLADAQDIAIRLVKAAAERAREKFITPGSGKTKEYEFKQTEVVKYRATEAAGGPLIAADYPWAIDRAELLTTPENTVSVADVIEEWEGLGNYWETIARQIAKLEEAAVEGIKSATQKEEIYNFLNNNWPAP